MNVFCLHLMTADKRIFVESSVNPMLENWKEITDDIETTGMVSLTNMRGKTEVAWSFSEVSTSTSKAWHWHKMESFACLFLGLVAIGQKMATETNSRWL